MTSPANRFLYLPTFRKLQAIATRTIRDCDTFLANNSRFACAVLAVFALQYTLIFTHRPWLDEYQALLLAVEAKDIPTLLHWLRYEGHPPLWHLILRGLSHVMPPLLALPVASAVIATIAQSCILFFSPFTRSERILIATSEFVLFEFFTLSRSLGLGVSLMILAMVFWRRRSVWIVIALLPMCDFLFGVLSGVLVLLKWRENRLWIPGLACWLLLALAAAWTVRPAPDLIPTIMEISPELRPWGFLSSIGTLMIPFQGGIHPMWSKPIFPIAGFLGPLFLYFCWTQIKDNFDRLLLFGFIFFTFVFSMTIYYLWIRHLMLISLLLILLIWRKRLQGDRPSSGFRLWLIAASIVGLATASINFVQPFDTAYLVAAKIRKLQLMDKHWMVYTDIPAAAVSALTGIDFERTEQRCMQSAIRWNYRPTLRTPQAVERYLRAEIQRHGRFYLLSNFNLAFLPRTIVKPLAAIPPGYDTHEYFLFEVGPGKAEKSIALPACMSNRRPFTEL